MKTRSILYVTGLFVATTALFSCDSYLDEMPDNRTTVDSEDKIVSLITSAYPTNDHLAITDFMTDDVDDMGSTFTYTSRFVDQIFAWEDVTESNNQSNESLWDACYMAIASANQALQAIEELGGPTTTTLKEAKGEALMCRAYSHFILTNVFCMAYNSKTSTTDVGIPYMEAPETELAPQYERGTVAEDYEKMAKDIEEALPLVGDTHLEVPKYHFNTQAAYAFAARFYLFYEQWEKAAECATQCLGSNPKSMLRDWAGVKSVGTHTAMRLEYIDATKSCNLMMLTSYSAAGLYSTNYYTWAKYSHNLYLAQTENFSASQIWGSASMRDPSISYQGSGINKCVVIKLPYLFEYTNEAAGIGYYRTVYPIFKGDNVLLDRAEAYIMLKQYDKACEDLTMWMQNYTTSTLTLTPEYVTEFYNAIDYYKWDEPTIKKQLHPQFSIDADGSTQECMLQCVLGFKRMENVYEGWRLFDIKRYGITIYRRLMNASGRPEKITDTMNARDLRQAIQIPTKVLSAGLEANPR